MKAILTVWACTENAGNVIAAASAAAAGRLRNFLRIAMERTSSLNFWKVAP